jgi:hypothetical protein
MALLTLGIGLAYPLVDQSAHVGGFVVGGAVALLLTPATRLGRGRVAKALAAVLVAASLAVTAYAAYGALTTSPAETVIHVGFAPHKLGNVTVDLPRTWMILDDASAVDPTWVLSPSLTVEVVSAADVAGVPRAAEEKLKAEEHVSEVSEVEPSYAIPEPWHAHELRFVYDAEGELAAFRKTIFVRPEGDGAISLSLLVPEAHLDSAVPVVIRLLSSASIK